MDGSATRLLDGRYRIGELLGEGATGTVSRAHDELLGRTVAIKLLKPAFGRDPEFVERFYAEARAAARIVDPRVVAIYDIISEEATHAIVMEYVDGPSLARALARDGRFLEARSIDVARQIAGALAAAHAQGMVHRDLKPANVCTTERGAIKVADFGLARAMGASALTLATPDGLVGSAHYMSPEQARGQKLAPASDLYSLGIMLYQFRFGRVPYTGDSPVAIALAHVDEPSPTFERLCDAMSADLARVVERLLRKDPLARYASATALDAALAQIETSRTSVRASATYDVDAPTIVARISAAPPSRPSPSSRSAASSQPVTKEPPRTKPPASATLARFARALYVASRGRALALAAASLGIVVAAIFVATFVAVTHPARVTLVDVRHRSLASARAMLARQRVRVDVVARSDERLSSGTIVSQKPPAGSALRAGDAVALVVSSGAPTLAIPNLIGSSFRDAVHRLKPVRLRVRYAAAFSNAPANSVIEEVPAAGTRVRVGSNAIVVISTGGQPQIRYSSR